MHERLIGIDAGGTMTKAALFDLEGREIACQHRPNKMIFAAPGWTERDPEIMWQATCGAVRALLEATGTAAGNVIGVTASGYGAGAYFVDADLRSVRPGIVSTDTRALDLIESYEVSGLKQILERMISSRLCAAHPIALLAWFDRHYPELRSKTNKVLFCKDFIRMRLCGDVATDPTDGGIAGLFDLHDGGYSQAAISAAGISGWMDKLPAVGGSVEIAGSLTAAAAQATGLMAGTPVIRGVVDVTGSSLASGVTGSEHISVVAGTFSINSSIRHTPMMDPPPFIQSSFPIDNQFIATEGAATSASNLEWIFSTLLEAEGAQAKANGTTIYEVANRLVAEAMDRDNNILFLPFLFGGPSRVPAGMIGLSARHTLGDVLRAAFEGVVFAHKCDIDKFAAGDQGPKPEVARLAGGVSRSELWGQMFSDVLGIPVEVANGSEFGAKGGAICAAAALGVYPSLQEAVSKMVRVERRYVPRTDRTTTYGRKLENYAVTVAALTARDFNSKGEKAV